MFGVKVSGIFGVAEQVVGDELHGKVQARFCTLIDRTLLQRCVWNRKYCGVSMHLVYRITLQTSGNLIESTFN